MLGRTVAILIVFSVVFAQSAYAQRLAEPVQ